jgi:hypothetical protein
MQRWCEGALGELGGEALLAELLRAGVALLVPLGTASAHSDGSAGIARAGIIFRSSYLAEIADFQRRRLGFQLAGGGF